MSNNESATRSTLPEDPFPVSRFIRETEFDGLVHWQGTFWEWYDGTYRSLSNGALRHVIYTVLDKHDRRPNKYSVANIMDALKAAAHISEEIHPGSWLSGARGSTDDLLPLANGILDLRTTELLPSTPDFFTLTALPIAYRSDTQPPAEWLKFLDSIWGDDRESIATLQEIFGCLLTDWTALQKIFLLVGPKRSGKGTIFRVLAAILGRENISAPTLSSFAQPFGLQTLIGKLVGLISDARLGSRSDQTTIVERLLAISGEDYVGIPRKYQLDYTAQLSVRFFLASNELPRLEDPSGALSSRFIVLSAPGSFYGEEDTELFSRFESEFEGILLWMIEGRRRLKARGHFEQPASSIEAMAMMEELGSPVMAFVRDKCELAPLYSVATDVLYSAWCEYSSLNDASNPKSKSVFGRDLSSALGNTISRSRPRQSDDSRVWVYRGLRLTGPGRSQV